MQTIDISNDILVSAHVDRLVVGDIEAAAYRRGAQSFDEARAVAQASIRDLVGRGLAVVGHWLADSFVPMVSTLGESFDRFVTAWNAGEDEYAIGLIALTTKGHALATSLSEETARRKRAILSTIRDRLAEQLPRETVEAFSLFDLVREAARSLSHPRRQLSPAIAADAFSILDEIYRDADADTKAVIEDELFEFEPGSSFDWINPHSAPALLSAIDRYRRVLALVAPHY